MGALDKYNQIRSEDEKLRFAEETAVAQVAVAFSSAVQNSVQSLKEISFKSDVSERHLGQILRAESKYLAVRTLACVAYTLGLRVEIRFVDDNRL